MREYIFGNEKQFKWFKGMLDDHQCHVYDCTMPPGCSPESSHIGFEYADGIYRIWIDYGITCNKRNDDDIYLTQFKQFLQDGQIMFMDFNDFKDFLANLKFLYS